MSTSMSLSMKNLVNEHTVQMRCIVERVSSLPIKNRDTSIMQRSNRPMYGNDQRSCAAYHNLTRTPKAILINQTLPNSALLIAYHTKARPQATNPHPTAFILLDRPETVSWPRHRLAFHAALALYLTRPNMLIPIPHLHSALPGTTGKTVNPRPLRRHSRSEVYQLGPWTGIISSAFWANTSSPRCYDVMWMWM
jgi:hypothetical protein